MYGTEVRRSGFHLCKPKINEVLDPQNLRPDRTCPNRSNRFVSQLIFGFCIPIGIMLDLQPCLIRCLFEIDLNFLMPLDSTSL